MPPPLLHHIYPTSLPAHCEPSSPFLTAISSYLHICIPTPLALVSSLLGTLSIVSWLFAQLPQIYKNYVLQSTSGLSLFFLVEWCLGDTANLLGALFTRQAGWQVVIAGYYVLVDITLVAQFFWYTHYKGRRNGHNDLSHSRSGEGTGDILEGASFSEENSIDSASSPDPTQKSEPKDVKPQYGASVNPLSYHSPSYSNEKKLGSSRRTIARSGSGPILPIASPRTILLASMLCAVLANANPTEMLASARTTQDAPMSTLEIVGRVSSWISTILYLGSRPPQLYKNYRRKSTSGLSPLLFMAAFCGNLFYSASLLTNPNAWYDFPAYGGGGWSDAQGNNRVEWVGRTIPFFLGAAGVLGLDGFMGVQFLMYGPKDDEAAFIKVDDPKRGRSRWRRVSGWMRGWIPSVSPARESTASEHQALLDDRRERYGAV